MLALRTLCACFLSLSACLVWVSTASAQCGCGGAVPTCQCQCQSCQQCQPIVIYKQAKHLCKHRCHNCYPEEAPPQRKSAPPVAEAPPKAAVVESLPMFNMTPGVFAMPMMMPMPMAVQPASYQPKSAPPETTCAASRDRIVEIEDRVNALDLRMQTIQRSLEIQTRILEEMKAEGKFPSRYLPQGAAVNN